LPYDLSNALHKTMDLVINIVNEESNYQYKIIFKLETLDALETPDVGLQMRQVLDFGMCIP
jgi:hypothetical protein